jgi:hypothetical protein
VLSQLRLAQRCRSDTGYGAGKRGGGGFGAGGSTPRYRAGQRPLPEGSTGVVAPRYPPGWGRVRVEGPAGGVGWVVGLYRSPSVAGCWRGGKVAPGGRAASRSARRYPARLTPSTLTCRPVRRTPARSSSSAKRSGLNSA